MLNTYVHCGGLVSEEPGADRQALHAHVTDPNKHPGHQGLG